MKKINVKVNGEKISLNEFASEFMINTVSGMLSSLKGVDDIKIVEIYFERE